jgi:RNA polymerase sigma-70 factor, ECF subfamily
MSQTLVAPAKDAPRDADVAFEELYRSSRDDVYAYVAGMLRDRSAAEDVTAAAFERAYRKRNRFNPRKGSRRAWLFGIARNATLDELRRRGRQAELASEPEDATLVAAVDVVEESDRKLEVRRALATLKARDRELIALKFFAGLNNSEIAMALGCSESNAGTRVHRAVTKLREAMS